jgi:hypothetical protein
MRSQCDQLILANFLPYFHYMKKSLVNLATLSIGAALLMALAPAGNIYFSRNGHVSFLSSTPLEDIKGDNNQVGTVLNTNTGGLDFTIAITAFQFDKAKLQEHFNENYMESTKFPKAIYKGTISNLSEIKFGTAGTYKAKVNGKMTMHGVTKDLAADGTIEVKGTQVIVKSTFNIDPADYQIKIPEAVKDKIAKSIKVSVDCVLNPKP